MQVITQTTPTFEQFYAQHLPLVRRVVARVQGPYQSYQDDLIQETFVRAWRYYSRLDHSQNVAGWIGRIAHRVICRFLRDMQAHHGLDCSLEQDDERPLDLADPHSGVQLRGVEESDAITRAYQSLAPKDRCVMDMLMQEYTQAEIGAVLHLDTSMCNGRIKRARRRFQRVYKRS